jgi:ADP-ribosyl-[dinitrogen reductase] hydrolase
VYPTVEEVVSRATTQARLTHDTPDGINSAVAAALMSHYFLYGLGPKAELGAFVARHVPGEWAQPWRGKVKSKRPMSVRAAITAIAEHDSRAPSCARASPSRAT